jgi:hypothetical protein
MWILCIDIIFYFFFFRFTIEQMIEPRTSCILPKSVTTKPNLMTYIYISGHRKSWGRPWFGFMRENECWSGLEFLHCSGSRTTYTKTKTTNSLDIPNNWIVLLVWSLFVGNILRAFLVYFLILHSSDVPNCPFTIFSLYTRHNTCQVTRFNLMVKSLSSRFEILYSIFISSI